MSSIVIVLYRTEPTLPIINLDSIDDPLYKITSVSDSVVGFVFIIRILLRRLH